VKEDGKLDNDKFQDLVIKKLEEQDKFQELVIRHFGDIQNQFRDIHNQFSDIHNQFEKVFTKLEDHDARFDRLEVFAKQHHEELELYTRQVETQEIRDISK
jgi:hypothetical protein